MRANQLTSLFGPTCELRGLAQLLHTCHNVVATKNKYNKIKAGKWENTLTTTSAAMGVASWAGSEVRHFCGHLQLLVVVGERQK